MKDTRKITTTGISWQKVRYRSSALAAHVGERAEVDDLGVERPPTIVATLPGGTVVLVHAMRPDLVEPVRRARFDAALRGSGYVGRLYPCTRAKEIAA